VKGSPAVRVEGLLCLALVAVCLAPIPALAAASDSPTVTITAPERGITIATRVVAVEAAFTAPRDTTVELIELVIDGVTVDARKIDPPAAEGTVSFTWLARDYADGRHRILVRATSSDGQVAKAQIAVVLRATPSLRDSAVRITSPAEGETVSGSATISVEVDNPALAKYVIFLVDDVLKAISNVRPFTYVWDTARYLNGVHILKAQAYAGGVGEAVSVPVQVRVDNPSGATTMREPKMTMSPVAPAPTAPPSRASEARMPPPVRAESPTPAYPEATPPSPTLAVPGTAPFVSPSGALITPPPPAPVEIAALPTFLESPAAPSQPIAPAQAPASASLAAALPSSAALAGASAPAQQGGPGVIAAESAVVAIAPAESAASGVREPVQAPIEIAMLPIPERRATVEPAPAPATPKPVEAAPVPEAPAPVALPPAEHSADVTEVAPASAAESQVAQAPRPAASELQIAMLPPRPVEALPAAKVAAEPISTQIAYVVRASSSLERIAAELGVPAAEIARANSLDVQSIVHAGQRLSIPSAAMTFDGRPLTFDAPAIVADGRAIVPFRAVMEGAGGQVTWDSKQRQARATARGHKIAVTIGSGQARVDGGAVAMGAAAQIRCDRTVVPLRFIGDALDLALQYQDGIIHIASAR